MCSYSSSWPSFFLCLDPRRQQLLPARLHSAAGHPMFCVDWETQANLSANRRSIFGRGFAVLRELSRWQGGRPEYEVFEYNSTTFLEPVIKKRRYLQHYA